MLKLMSHKIIRFYIKPYNTYLIFERRLYSILRVSQNENGLLKIQNNQNMLPLKILRKERCTGRECTFRLAHEEETLNISTDTPTHFPFKDDESFPLSSELEEGIHDRKISEISDVNADFVLIPEKHKKLLKKSDEEKLTILQEKKEENRKLFLNMYLTSYIFVCMDVGFQKDALKFFGECSKFHSDILSIEVYNEVLRGLSQHNMFEKFEKVLTHLKSSSVKPNVDSFGIILSYLGSMTSKADMINDTLSWMKSENISLKSMFECAVFMGDSLEHCINGLSQVNIELNNIFKIQDDDEKYDNILMNSLNDGLFSNHVNSPLKDVISSDRLRDIAESQLNLELELNVSFPRVFRKDNPDAMKLYEEWKSSWKVELKQAFRSYKKIMKKNKKKNVMFLLVLSEDEFVDIMIMEIEKISNHFNSFSPPMRKLECELGRLVYDRYRISCMKKHKHIEKLKTIYKYYCNWYLDKSKYPNFSYIPRLFWKQASYEHKINLNFSIPPWPDTLLSQIGGMLYDIILANTKVWTNSKGTRLLYPAVHRTVCIHESKQLTELKPSPVLVKLVNSFFLPTMSFPSSLLPMMSPPLPWINTKEGGYLLVLSNLIRSSAKEQFYRFEDIPSNKQYPIYDAMNALSSIPWKVNKEILEIVTEKFKNGGWPEMDIPSFDIEPLKLATNVESKMSYKKIQQLKREKMDNYGIWCDAHYKISLANHYKDKVFWLPHNIDFRGRTYPIPPYFTHLSSDVFRSLFLFAQGKPLGKEGFFWLKLHVINLSGLKKYNNISERIKFCDEIMDEIVDSADNPLDGKRFWTTVSTPWQFLAACKELVAASRSDNPEEYISHFPIHQDGSCNGLQHYAALGRDLRGGMSVNLTPSELPQDVYTTVLNEVEKRRKEDMADGYRIAQVLDGFVSRKVVKQTVMTTVYGVTNYGAVSQIYKQLKDIPTFPEEYRGKGAAYLSDKVFLSLGEIFSSTKVVQNWLTECARCLSQNMNLDVSWVTPLDFPVIQPYKKGEVVQIKGSSSMKTSNYVKFLDYRTHSIKQRNGFPPNFIHSLDASHMALTSLFCQKEGITFISIHDCFWTHPSTVAIMNRICREQFVSLYSRNIMEDLCKELLSYVDNNKMNISQRKLKRIKSTISDVPKQGELDIRGVLNSTFFFS